MDMLTTSNLEDSLCLEEKPEETSEKDIDKMNRMACGVIRSYLVKDIKYLVMTEASARNI